MVPTKCRGCRKKERAWKLELEERPDGWWIVGLPEDAGSECGPWKLNKEKGEAKEAMKGLIAFSRCGHCETFWVTD